MSTVLEAVLSVMKDVSGNFVPCPNHLEVREDLIRGFKRFRASVRWHFFFLLHPSGSEDFPNESSSAGLRTGLHPPRGVKTGPRSNPQVELFLRLLEEKLHSHLDSARVRPNRDSRRVMTLVRRVQESDYVVVPTDKTNSYSVIPVHVYKEVLCTHISNACVEISPLALRGIQREALEKITGFKGLLSQDEFRYVVRGIESRAVPVPMVTVKDHKQPRANGEYPTRFIVPASTGGYLLSPQSCFRKSNPSYGIRC